MKRLSGLDAAFLSSETENWPAHVACITIFDPAKAGREFDLDVLKRSLAARLDRLPPLRWRVIEAPLGLGHPHWIEDPDFDLDWHIRRMGIAKPGGKRELAAAAQDIYRHRLDRRRPLWELWVLDHLADGKVALLWKIHHACIDGMAGAGMQEVMFDASPDYQPPDRVESDAWIPEAVPDPTRLMISSIPAAAAAQVRAGREIIRMLGRIGEVIKSVGAAMPHDVPRTRFNQPLGQRRAWGFVSLSLNDLKTVKNAFGVKLNDVFVAAVSGGIRSYLERRRELPEHSLIASIPVNARADDSPSTGNAISGMTATLATDLPDSVDRLRAIHASTMASKEMQRAMGAQTLMSLADTPPPAMFSLAARFYGKSQLVKRLPPMFNVVISNVPGPREPLYSQGAPVEAFHSMGIIYDGAGLFIGAMSYLDQMDVGLLADPDALDDPFELADGIANELAHLVVRAREEVASQKKPRPAHDVEPIAKGRAARSKEKSANPVAMSRTRRKVLTTGCNSGLGLATVLEMARRGHESIGTVRSLEKSEIVAEAAERAGVEVATRILDVTDADACAAVVGEVEPDVLVNNAGYMIYAAIEDVGDAEARDLLETIVVAPTRLARLCVPHMRRRKWGRIIQVSSISARVSFPLMGWYQGCKQALEGISDAMRMELASAGIGVAIVEPGNFRSEMSEQFSAPKNVEDSRYAKAYERSGSFYERLGAMMTDAETVAGVIADAVTVRSLRARYPVGLDAQFNILSDPITPTGLRDRALRSVFGL